MKRIVFSLVLFLGFAATVSAQEPTADRIKPAGGDFGLGFKITGLSNVGFSEWDSDHFAIPQILGRYYISDKFALRARVGLDLKNVRDRYSTGTDRPQVPPPITKDTVIESQIKSSNFSFFPGVEYHLASPATKIDPYVGFEAGISVMGSTTETTTTKMEDHDNNNQGQLVFSSLITQTTITPGGLGVGGNAILGFNYFFSDNFAIGAEYTIGTAYSKSGGIATTTINGLDTQPQVPSSNIYSSEYTTEVLKYDMRTRIRSTGGVNISVFW